MQQPYPSIGRTNFSETLYNPATPHCFDLDARNRVYLERAASEWVDTGQYNVFYCASHDHGITWSQPLRLNDAPIAGQDFVRMQGFSRPGEYIGMASTDDYAYPVWIEGGHAYTWRLTRGFAPALWHHSPPRPGSSGGGRSARPAAQPHTGPGPAARMAK